MNFGKIFGANFLINFCSTTGNIVGGLLGGSYANYKANQLFGEQISGSQIIQTGVAGETPLWAIRFFRWLFV